MKTKRENSPPPYFPFSDEPAPKILFIQHFNLLCDDRMEKWEKSINQVVREGDVVLDLGSGTGILSMFAARKAKRVWAVEVDPHLVRYSQSAIEKNGFSDKIKVISANAGEVVFPETPDVIICEMLDTALIKEQLVQVMNSVRKKIGDGNPRILPSGVITSVALTHVDYDFSGFYMPLPYFETKEVRKTNGLFSDIIPYHVVDTAKFNPISVDEKLSIPVTHEGEVNSLKIITNVEMCDGTVCAPSHWFNPPLVLPIGSMHVKRGDIINLKISYELGEGLKTVHYEVNK
ncbi:MAG: 50S ribosomal protein L11 methyltransferase [Candidatus Eremiobacteraeota bacterium]|nr:50S ribosomal protein L11 methyltransferase [Candidatus Eremiobacteraeota bacterium]